LLLFQVTRLITWIICRLYFRISFHGVENVPREGPVILSPNHTSFIDPIWVSIPLNRPMRYMTWDRFIYMPVLGWLIRIYGGFPVKLQSGDRAALREALRQLRAGGPLVIFPEGGRTRTGHIMPFKPGFVRLAIDARVPIVPVTINGAYEAFSPHHRFPRPRKISITYHLPIHLTPPDNADELKVYLHQQSARICQIIAADLPAPPTVSRIHVEQ
jgi:1-acyl-sn-glycerol-3-phosphate acyltransferase